MADGASDVPIARQTADLAGHGEAERVLLDAHRSGRLPHAWLITGPRGIGKATLAYRFARFLLAEGAGTAPGLFGAKLPAESLAVPADSPVFRRVAAASHPDLFVVERRYDDKRGRLRGEIVVEDVRDLGQFLHLTPAEGGWRVVVIDSADEMNRNSANAVLKLLEEPPKRAVLLLVSHAPGGLLPTIRSRCRKLPLKSLDEAVLASLLRRHAPDLDESERQGLARLAEGSIGRALELAAAGGLALYRDLIDLCAHLPQLDPSAAHKFADRFGRKGQENAFATAADLMARWLGRAVRAGATGQPPAEVVPGEAALAHRLIAATAGDPRGLDRWLDLWDKVAGLADRAEGANLDRKLVFLNALFGLEAAARG